PVASWSWRLVIDVSAKVSRIVNRFSSDSAASVGTSNWARSAGLRSDAGMDKEISVSILRYYQASACISSNGLNIGKGVPSGLSRASHFQGSGTPSTTMD